MEFCVTREVRTLCYNVFIEGMTSGLFVAASIKFVKSAYNDSGKKTFKYMMEQKGEIRFLAM